jgi:eukaryotic-like serine/threonine-protein kinase
MSSGSNVPGGQRASDAPHGSSPLAGRTSLGKYQIQRELGTGGMGTVYLAIDTNLKRTIALKVLHRERTANDTLVRRFESEARAAAQLKHENIVTVYDAGQIDGNLFIALEFVDGTDIHELVARRGPIPLKRSIGFIKQIARALEHLNNQGFVHRDIKPSNLLLTKEGIVKLTDLGLARAVDESMQSNITREGTTVGTVDYMSPEQARNSQAADIRSDIYSLGCTWYQMLTGDPPFPDGSVTNKLYAHISKPRPDPRASNPNIPEEIVAILQRMMARKTDDRYQTPQDLIKDLDNLGSGFKRLEELLHSDADDNSPPASTSSRHTPAHGSPLPLPPRHPLKAKADDSHPPQRHDIDHPPADSRTPTRQLPGRRMPVPDREMPPARGASSDRQLPVGATPGTGSGRHRLPAALPPAKGASSDRQLPVGRRGGVISDEPSGRSRDPNRPLSETTSAASWQPSPVQIGVVVAVAVAGLLIWLGASYWNNGNASNGTDVTRNPFDPLARGQQAAPVDDEAAKKTDDKQAADEKRNKKGSGKQGKSLVVAESKALGSVDKSIAAALVPGRPDERAEFPAWIAELWDPRSPPAFKGTIGLKVLTVGRSGHEPAQFSSLADAIAEIPPDGAVIELRGPGPFLLPAQRIEKRRQVVFTGIGAQDASTAPAGAAEVAHRPLVVIVPPPASKTAGGIIGSESSLTFYGVHLIAFADQFRGEDPLRLVDVRSGNLTVQKCSLTLVGARNGPTIAFSVSAPRPSADHAPRVLIDRTVVRGNDLTAVDADIPNLDLLAINSLFATGKAPLLALSSNSALPGMASDNRLARTLRFFSATACSDESTISLRANPDSSDPPLTRFLVLNSVFGVVSQPQSSMVAINSWPTLADGPANAGRFKNLSWKSQSFVARGWQSNLVANDGSVHLGVRDASDWGRFWGDPRSSIDCKTAQLANVRDFSTVTPEQFQPEKSLLHQSADEPAAAGCNTALLAVCGPDLIRRAEAFSRRPAAPSEMDDEPRAGAAVREVNLDNPVRSSKEDLGKIISQMDWPDGTRFLVRGSKKKACSPIRVVNRSLTIEFADKALVLAFDDRKVDASASRDAFITVAGGSINIVNATMLIEPSTRPSTRRLLDVQGGSFSIRNSVLSGPPRENPGYESLIQFSATQDASQPAGEGEPLVGSVRNSFLSSVKTVFSGDLAARNLLIENSILVAGNRIFDVRLPTSPATSVVDLRSCTLSSGTEYFHFSSRNADGTPGRVRVFVDNSLFAPPIRATQNASTRAILFGSASPEFFRERVDWWEAGNAYSDLIELPGSGASAGSKPDATSDSFENWQQVAGPAHILRSIGQTGAVLLAGDLPAIKDVAPADFQLKTEAPAARWSDAGKAVGANLASLPAPRANRAPVVKANAKAAGGKSPTSKSSAGKAPASKASKKPAAQSPGI